MARKDFPFFNIYNNVTFLDSAASTQKPKCMINKIYEIYTYSYTNVNRGNYRLSINLTKQYEDVRILISKFINASSIYEIIFTPSTTIGINIIAKVWGRKVLSKGDEVLISNLEHHSNIAPWQQLCKEKKATLVIITIKKCGEINQNSLKKTISKRIKIVSITHMSNVLGNIINIKNLINILRKYNSKVLIDASQSISNTKINVKELDCDFLVFSSHKLYGSTGLGILYIKYKNIIKMNIFFFGSSITDYFSFEKKLFLPAPYKFESGTPAICEILSFGETLKYLNKLDLDDKWNKKDNLLNFLMNEVKSLNSFYILNVKNRKSILSLLNLETKFEDINIVLEKNNIATRSGYHCCKPLMDFLCIEGTLRVSLGIYNNFNDIYKLIKSLKKLVK